MGDKARTPRPTAVARKWLEDPGGGHVPAVVRGDLTCLVMAGARVSVAEPGRVVCSLRVRAPLADAEGRWHAGAIAAAVDNMCAAVVFTVEGGPVVTVDYAMSYFAPAHHDEEVEMDGRVAGRNGQLTAAEVEVRSKDSGELLAEEVEMEGRVVGWKGKLTATAVEVRNKDSGELVALARQWVTPAPLSTNKTRSKL